MNLEQTLGFESPKSAKGLKGLVRGFAEIDLRQIKSLSDRINANLVFRKFDLEQIEPESTTSIFDGETIFSLFSDQSLLYETVLDQVLQFGSDDDHQLLRLDTNGGVLGHKVLLSAMLMKPTPLIVQDGDDVAEMSIVKQCLLFNETRAAILVYKLTKVCTNISFEDYVACLEDFEIMIEKLPAQQYLFILQRFKDNFQTRKVALAEFHGTKAHQR